MVLARLLDGVLVRKFFAELYGRMVPTQDLGIRSVQYDSRKVGPNDLFVAIRGTALDGHQFIDRSIAQGAVAVVVDDDQAVPDAVFHHAGVFKIVVPDSREALAALAANFYGHPSRRLHLVGVTGTNGKTTTTYLVKSILEASGEKVGLIGTIEYRIAEEVFPATHTTPESLELQKLLAEMAARGCSSVVMEVSSHALAMRRVHGMDFQVGIFTNLTQDHLDFHGTLEEYFRAKKRLFDRLSSGATAVVNADDPYGLRIASGGAARQLTYAMAGPADLTAAATRVDIRGMTLSCRHRDREHLLETSLTGRFNVQNVLAACGAGVALGVPWEAIRRGIRGLALVRGRFEHYGRTRQGAAGGRRGRHLRFGTDGSMGGSEEPDPRDPVRRSRRTDPCESSSSALSNSHPYYE